MFGVSVSTSFRENHQIHMFALLLNIESRLHSNDIIWSILVSESLSFIRLLPLSPGAGNSRLDFANALFNIYGAAVVVVFTLHSII